MQKNIKFASVQVLYLPIANNLHTITTIMKKFLLGALMLSAVAPFAMSQDASIWKSNKGITLGFITHQSLKWDEGGEDFQYNSRYGFSLSVGTQYLWPKGQGWAGNRIKVGVDARWYDMSYVNYKKWPEYKGDSDWDDYFDDDYDYDYGYDDDEEEFDLGIHQLTIGMGVGPAVVVAPFSNSGNALRFLRANLYCHFNPSASLILYKDYEGDTQASWAFVPGIDYGLNFQWKFVTLGVEGRWGAAKYKNIISDDEDDWDYDEGGVSYRGSDSKIKFKHPSFRITLGFRW